MDSAEALMENENNSNLESESGIGDRSQKLIPEQLCDGAFPVGVISGISAAFTGTGILNSTAEIKSSLNEGLASTNITIRDCRNNGIDDLEEALQFEKIMEVNQLEGTSKSALISDNRVDDITTCESGDTLQHGEEILSRGSESLSEKRTDGTVFETQNPKEPFISVSQEEDDVIFIHSESLCDSQTTDKVQQLDVNDVSESNYQSSQLKNKKPSADTNTVVNSKNSEKNMYASSKEFCAVAGASKYWDDDVNLLEENSQDSVKQKDSIVSLDSLTDSEAVVILSGKNNTYKPDVLRVSSNVVENAYRDNLTEALVESGLYTAVRTVPRSTMPELDSSAEQRVINELLKRHGNGSRVVSKTSLAQPQSKQDCKKDENVEAVLQEEIVTLVKKQNETLVFCNKAFSEAGVIPGQSIHDDLTNENINDINNGEDMDVEDGAEEAETNPCLEKESSSRREQSTQKNSALLEDVVAQYVESDSVSDDTFKLSSVNRTVSQYTSSSEFSKQISSADDVNKNCVQREEIIAMTTEAAVKKPSRSSSEDTSLAIDLTGTDTSQSFIKSTVGLPLGNKIFSVAVFDPMESAREKNKTLATVGSCESNDVQSRINSSTENVTPETTKRNERSAELITEFGLIIKTEETSITSTVISNSGQTGSVKSNGSLSNTASLTEYAGSKYLSNEDLIDISEIKKEHAASKADVPTDSPSVLFKNKNDQVQVRVKQEQGTEKAEDSDEDVVVIDDEGEFVPVKKEILQSTAANNGPEIQISAAVSSQQLQVVSSDAGNKTDSSKSKPARSNLQICIVCYKVCRCKYNIVRNGDIKHLCDDPCFKLFRKSPAVFLKLKDNSNTTNILSEKIPSTSQLKDVAFSSVESRQESSYKTCAVCQLTDVNTPQPFCNWKGLDFCGESCLGKFQANLNSSCSYCQTQIPVTMRTTFCLKIGNDMHSFCKQRCYYEFKKKKLRLCSFCQKDVTAVPGAFTAMVGTDKRFKEFCSQDCMKKLESQVTDMEVFSVEKGNLQLETITCSVCEKQGEMKYTVRLQDKVNKLCSDLCLSAFQYTNKIIMGKCDSCGTICTAEAAQAHFVQYEGKAKRFCSDICVGAFRKANSKVMPCGWCCTLKLNFDMIERLDAENKFQMFCSLNCLSLYRVNLQAKSNQAVPCDQCRKVIPAQYHLTMSDASVRNFCSYACVMTFQAQFAVKQVSGFGSTPSPSAALPGFGSAPSPSAAPPIPTQTQQQGTPVQQSQQQGTPVQQSQQQNTAATWGAQGRMTTRQAAARQQSPTVPVISNVVSLAELAGDPPTLSPQVPPVTLSSQVPSVTLSSQVPSVTLSSQVPSVAPPLLPASPDTGFVNNMVASGDGKHQIVIQAAPPKYVRNKSLQCRPITQTKATSCRPHSQNKEVQTDEVLVTSVVVPVPVPIYIPMPTVMFSAPTPKLLPVPIPIPVPVFIPTTKKSVSGICKTIQDIVERIPADPLEAELLMMAEAVAADKSSSDSDTDTEADVAEDFVIDVERDVMIPEAKVSESPVMMKEDLEEEESVLQVALRLAEEMSGPIEDLETSVEPVAVGKEPPNQEHKPVPEYHSQDDGDDNDDDYIPSRPVRNRASKRSNRGRPSASSRPKRQRVEKSYTEDDSVLPELSVQPQSVEVAPDANYRLKFTYGLNAWRHWVLSKNLQIEKSKSLGNFRARTFPTDILKCTTEELNMSLCMFLTEVRKPSGKEYSADSIYYLCLGIQQYLYENGRIDSIFTDSYYEKFIDSLHEILKTLEPKVNSSGQMLCRIEEEHLWESKQLGAHSPFVLLNTLIYFHTKYFILKTAQEHMSLSFAQILKHWKKGMPVKGQTVSAAKNVSLRFYCITNGKKDGTQKRGKEGVPVYEVTENIDNPLRCPVKLYEFFLSKCPESIKNRNDIFYPVPERSCVPDSPVWYSTASINIHTLDKMLTRVLLVREIQEAHLHAQPTYL